MAIEGCNWLISEFNCSNCCCSTRCLIIEVLLVSSLERMQVGDREEEGRYLDIYITELSFRS